MTKETQQIKEYADRHIALFKAGNATYDEAVAATKLYIDHANCIARRIAKEHGMRPRFMSVKAYMR